MFTRSAFIILSALLLLSFFSFTPQRVEGITITINGLRNDKGYVLISLFKDGDGFPDKPEKAYRKQKLAITNKSVAVYFADVPAGNYAAAILHDENNDGKMNTNFFGIPKEGYGFSNNVMGTFGPPAYSRAMFTRKSGEVLSTVINARY